MKMGRLEGLPVSFVNHGFVIVRADTGVCPYMWGFHLILTNTG